MHLVIVGGSDAGTPAALRARELDPAGEVAVVAADASFVARSVPPTPFSRRAAVVAAVALGMSGCRRPVPGIGRPLVIIFGPQHTPANLEALRAELERTSGLKLKLEGTWSNDSAVDLVQSGLADAALLPLFDYFFCAGVFDVDPLVQLLRSGGDTQSGELLVTAQSTVTDLTALRGQRVGYVGRYSVTGFLLPAALLRQASVSVEPVWLGTHDAVLAAVQAGEVAAGASYSGHGATVTGLRVLAATPPIANEPLFVQKQLPAEVRAALKRGLIAVQDSKYLLGIADATGFRAPPADAYENALKTLRAAGLREEDTVERGWIRANEHRRPAWSYEP
jgi:ABC-type phosphate/phosphonate transport system substrate-binding protein